MEIGLTDFLKISITPILIFLVSKAEERYGQKVSGMLVGLPLTTAPVVLILYMEYGLLFTWNVLTGVILSVTSSIVFCVSYFVLARMMSWKLTLAASLLLFSLTASIFEKISLSFVVDSLIATGFLVASLFLRTDTNPEINASKFKGDTEYRVVTATLIVLLITTYANDVGSVLSGIVSNSPVFISTFAVFNHRKGGFLAARSFIQGTIRGTIAYFAFFVLLYVTIFKLTIWESFALSVAASLVISELTYLLTSSRKPFPSYESP